MYNVIVNLREYNSNIKVKENNEVRNMAMIFFLVLAMLMLSSCHSKLRVTESHVIQGPSCTVVKIGSISTITCPDGTSSVINDGSSGVDGSDGLNGNDGSNGSNGQDGLNGSNGHSIAFSQASASIGLCSNSGVVISMGVDLDDNSLLSLSETTQVATICNGSNGVDGTNGQDGSNAAPSPFTPVSLIDPCGDAPNKYDEVFLKMSNGTVLASFSDNANGQNTRFSVLTAGSYVTTDGDNCAFSIDSSGVIVSENHHY